MTRCHPFRRANLHKARELNVDEKSPHYVHVHTSIILYSQLKYQHAVRCKQIPSE